MGLGKRKRRGGRDGNDASNDDFIDDDLASDLDAEFVVSSGEERRQ